MRPGFICSLYILTRKPEFQEENYFQVSSGGVRITYVDLDCWYNPLPPPKNRSEAKRRIGVKQKVLFLLLFLFSPGAHRDGRRGSVFARFTHVLARHIHINFLVHTHVGAPIRFMAVTSG